MGCFTGFFGISVLQGFGFRIQGVIGFGRVHQGFCMFSAGSTGVYAVYGSTFKTAFLYGCFRTPLEFERIQGLRLLFLGGQRGTQAPTPSRPIGP